MRSSWGALSSPLLSGPSAGEMSRRRRWRMRERRNEPTKSAMPERSDQGRSKGVAETRSQIDVAAGDVAQIGQADIGDVDRVRLRQEPVQQVGVLRGLHVDREAEILAGLLGDPRDRGDRR